ncbi:hypothetical protein [Pontiella sulfatireligans]|uniref:PEP-CTERM protein-sorting domain-containing protein n=1 Tax=Pontiella sulfatireligans TaxID=2750658 RepID=A0A6C2UH84_9BACT|nr:hypothetical protein [Pontiella sulfatireligans]VGO18714.1 hypothetical protein SCARR_00767 [Pontiella sulfatireligans]
MKKIIGIITVALMGTTLAQAALFTEDFNETVGTAFTALPAEVAGTSWSAGSALLDGRVSANPTTGSNVGELNGTGNEKTEANFASTAVSTALQVNFDLFINLNTVLPRDLGAQLEFTPNATTDMEIEFNQGGNITLVGGNLAFASGSGTTHLGDDVWQDITVSYNNVTANSYEMDLTMTDGTTTSYATIIASGLVASDMSINRYRFGMHGGNDETIFIDDLSVVIPEPATLGLVAVFGGAVMFIRRRFMI